MTQMRKCVFVTMFLVLMAGMALADVTYPQYTHLTASQTGGPFLTSLGGGFNQWDTQLKSTNTGPTEEKIWFVWTHAQVNDANGSHTMTWNNTLSQFEWTDTSGALHTASGLNQAFMISLGSTVTNIPIPAASGLTTADSVPAFLVGDLAPGATANWVVQQKLSSNINSFNFNGSFVGQEVPEPGSFLLLGSGLAAMAGTFRRKFRK